MPKSKTKPTYRETKFGVLSVAEIEAFITDGVANVNAFLLREYENLLIGVKTADFQFYRHQTDRFHKLHEESDHRAQSRKRCQIDK